MATPWCQCGEGLETAAHLVLDCGELLQQRIKLQRLQQPLALCTYRDFVEAATQPGRARQLVHWLLSTRMFPEFRLAERYRREEGEERSGTTEAQSLDISVSDHTNTYTAS